MFFAQPVLGSWYFRWVEDSYGPIKKHIGIELYSPKPDDLPANVEWIQNSVSDMVDIASSSVDMLSLVRISSIYILMTCEGFFQKRTA